MKAHNKHVFLPWSIALTGLTSITAQILLMRELVVIFYGNELSMGTMLGVWLFWTAIGSGLMAKIFKRSSHPYLSFASIQFLISLSLLPILLLVRSSREFIGITPGELIGFTPMLILTVITLAPLCLLSGVLYTLACQTISKNIKRASDAIAKVYLLEAIGAGLGGLAASLFLVRLVSPVHIFLFLSILNFVSAVLLGNINPFLSKYYRAAWVLLFTLDFVIIGFILSNPLQTISKKNLWKGYQLITTQNTIYGNISATQMGSQVSFFENGLLVFTVPDRLSAEESVHYTLLEHPCPRKVLLIGGGLGGGIRETLRHPTITNVEYLELDPSIVQMAQKLLPDEHILHLKDPRVHIHNMDARRYIKLSKKSFDIVILNLPNPYTAQLNRFYTLEFFTEVNKILRPGGVFSLHVTSSENAIGPELSNFLSTIHATLSAVFPDIVTLPGETARFIVSNKPGLLTSDPQILVSRLKNRKLETKYVREYRFPYDMLKERQDYLKSNLHSIPQNQLNRDFKPVGYFYDTILWATTYSANFKKLFLAFARIRPYSFVGFFLLTVLILIGISWIRRGKTTLFSTGILYSIIGIGFTEISLVVILILGFQVLYGHVYQQLALIVAGYMIGLALGSWLVANANIQAKKIFPLFRFLQFLMVLYPILIAALFHLFHNSTYFDSHLGLLSWIFPFLSAGAGLLGGYQFPMANRLYLRSGKSIGKVAGFLYSFDLIGSSMGALLTSALLIPILGIPFTLALLSLFNVCAFIILLFSKGEY